MTGFSLKKILCCLAAIMFICSSGAFCDAALVSNFAHLTSPDVLTDGIASAAVLMSLPVIPTFDIETLTVVTRQEFDALQAKYGKLYVINVEIDESEKHQFIVRRPTRQHLELIESCRKKDLSKVNDIIIKNYTVAGDTDALNDGIVYSGFVAEIIKITQQVKSFLAKA